MTRDNLAELLSKIATRLFVVLIALVLSGARAVAQDLPLDTAEITRQAEALRAEQSAIASELLTRHPRDFDALRIMGYVHSSHGNQEKMFECWQKCCQLRPDRADIHEQLGRYAFQSEKYKEAIEHWKMALKINPKMNGIYQQVGHAFLNLGQAEHAQRALRQEIKQNPKASQAWYLLGEALFQSQDFANAKKSYLAAAKLLPSHRHAYYGLIKTCARLQQTDEASVYARQFQKLENAADNADLETRRQFDDLQQIREKLAVTCVDAGRVYLRDKDAQQAKRLWARAATLDPNNLSSRSLLGELHAKQRQLPQAIERYQELAKLQPGSIGHPRQIGMLYARLGNLKAAEAAFKRMLENDPDNAAGHRMLAKFYLNTNQQSARALKLARHAVKLEPVADSLFVLGWSSAKAGKLADARAALKEAIRLDPDNATYRKLYEAVEKSSPRTEQKGN